MDDLAEIVWRKALQARGRDWVMSELHTRPGRPEDIVYDVVFEGPYPTRAFCLQWCAEQENRILRMSWHTYASIIALILFVICFYQAVHSWQPPVAQLPTAAAMSRPPVSGNADNITNNVPSQGASSAGGAASGDNNSSSSNNLPSICAYINYDTTRCKIQN